MTPPLKTLYLARRNPRYDSAAFIERWRLHGANGMAKERWSKNVRWYAQCSRIACVDYPGAAEDADGVGYNLFYSAEHRKAHRADTTAQTAQERDELETFAEAVRKADVQATEEQSYGDRNTAIRLFRFVWRRADEISHDEFWASYQSPLPDEQAVGTRPISFFSLNRTVGSSLPTSELNCDVIEEYGYQNVEDLQSDASALRDLGTDPAVARTLFYITRAVVLYEAPSILRS